MINHRGLKRGQQKGVVFHIEMYRGIERSQFTPNFNFPPKGLERSFMHRNLITYM